MPVPMMYQPTERKSAMLFHFDAEMLSLAAFSGQAATFVRAGASAATVPGRNGNLPAHPEDLPVFGAVDLDSDGTRERASLRLDGANADSLYWDFLYLPRAMTGLLEFVQIGAPLGRILSIGGSVGPRVFLQENGGVWRLSHQNSNGGTTVHSSMGAAPTDGQRVRLRWELYSDGAVQLHQTIGTATETHATKSAANALAAAWSETRVYAFGLGTDPSIDLLASRIDAGSGLAVAQLEGRF